MFGLLELLFVSGFTYLPDPKLWGVLQGTLLELQNVYVCSKQLTVDEDLEDKISSTIPNMKAFSSCKHTSNDVIYAKTRTREF